MKSRILSIFFSMYICCGAVSQLSALSFNWFKLMYESSKATINFTIDSIEDSLGKILGSQSKQFAEFKAKSDALQAEIIKQLDAITVANKKSGLEKANALFKELREQEDALLEEARKTLSATDYDQLAHIIRARQVISAQKINDLPTLKMLSNIAGSLRIAFASWLPTPSLGRDIKGLVESANPLGMQDVSRDTGLDFHERVYLKNREPIVKKALKNVLDYQGSDYPILSFSGTGGGYRAMILTTGYCRALSEIGLLDGMSYMTGLSGSTWFLAPWISSGLSVEKFQDLLRQKIREDKFDLRKVQYQLPNLLSSIITDVLWPKFIYSQPISSVDLFGALLANVLFSTFGRFMHKQTLSSQLRKTVDGTMPFPIYTSVSMHNVQGTYRYHWYEFNPLAVRNLELHLSVPSTTFGSSFYRGYVKQAAPEQSLGFLLGTFGSAYTVNVKDIDRILYTSMMQKEQANAMAAEGVAQAKFDVVKSLLSVMKDLSPISTVRFSPTQIANPFYGYTPEVGWLNERILLTFIDAGIAYNIPIRPLMLPERKMRALIIGESSGNADTGQELYKAFDDLKRIYGYEYTRVDAEGSDVVRFYKDLKHPLAPKIVYVTFLKDHALLEKEKDGPLKELIEKAELVSFDPMRCLEKEACGTFNFDYSLKDFNQLSGIGEFNLRANRERIIQFLKEAIQ